MGSCAHGSEIMRFVKVVNFLISFFVGFTRRAENTVRASRLEHVVVSDVGVTAKSGLRIFRLIRQVPRGQTAWYLETNYEKPII